MKILQVIKTSEGALWAVRQVSELVRSGVDVHVLLPAKDGAAIPAWRQTGATLHFLDCRRVPLDPRVLRRTLKDIRELVNKIGPNLIHSHFVSTTLLLRLALGTRNRIPRIFQVPGPLHLEYWHTRKLEIALADENDFWIGSSRCIVRNYERAGVPRERLYLSYYSIDVRAFSYARSGWLRERLGIPADAFVVGNINLIYPPKRYLGQSVGLKCHEDVIEAIRLAQREMPNVWGVLVGGTFCNNSAYEQRLRKLAREKGRGQILMPGKFNSEEVARSWPDFDCAVHVPASENCGGVVEPLLCEVPTIAGKVGGLPEVVHDGLTGELVPIHRPDLLATHILDVMQDQSRHKRLARRGGKLVSRMFDPQRCTQEILQIYRHVLEGSSRPPDFNSEGFLAKNTQETKEAFRTITTDVEELCSV